MGTSRASHKGEMKQFPSEEPTVTPLEFGIVMILALLAILAVAQGLGSLGAGVAAAEHIAPLR